MNAVPMWLLNTQTFKLEEFYSDVPSYAVLSHRWQKDEEVSFGGLEEPHPYSNRAGYKKIKDFCAEAQKRRLAYVWVDTCCIDKKSSAELSEAINSMYTYYNRAKICYAYLYDVVSMRDFRQSSWFTRGWTLQELLAPPKLHFFNHLWKPIGSRRRLAPKIGRVTGIPVSALQHLNLAGYCVAEKLSWSAQRQTTREEDRAYCLLGLFQINMPLLYGEGARAFPRLQEEIMRVSTDMSIFMWHGLAVETFGMLASDPACFSNLPDRVKSMARTCKTLFSTLEGWSLDNSGIGITVSICPYLLTNEFECIYALHLHEPYTFCNVPGFAIFVRHHGDRMGIRCFERVTIDGVAWNSSRDRPIAHPVFGNRVEKVRILRQPLEDIRTSADETCGFVVSFVTDAAVSCAAYQRPCGDSHDDLRSWREMQMTCSGSLDCSFQENCNNATGLHGYLLLTLLDEVQIMICLGLNHAFQPLCIALPLCKRILDEGLTCTSVLRKYNCISRGEEGFFEIFDTEIHMACLQGEQQALESRTDIGISLEISDTSCYAGMFKAEINFDIGQFIQYYVPTADVSYYVYSDSIPRATFDSLLDAGFKIDAGRQNRYFF
jgi:hypothetical protein